MMASSASSSSLWLEERRRKSNHDDESEFIDQLSSPVGGGGGAGGRISSDDDDEAEDAETRNIAHNSYQSLLLAASPSGRSISVARLLITRSNVEPIWVTESSSTSVSMIQRSPLTYKIKLKRGDLHEFLVRPLKVQQFSGEYGNEEWTVLHMPEAEVGNNESAQVTLWIPRDESIGSLLPSAEPKASERLSRKQVESLQQQFDLAQTYHSYDEVAATEVENDDDEESPRMACRSDEEAQLSSAHKSRVGRNNAQATNAIEISDDEDAEDVKKPRPAKRTMASDLSSSVHEGIPWLPQRTQQEVLPQKGSSRKKKTASKAKPKSPSPTGAGPMDRHCTIDLTADDDGSKRKKRKQDSEEHGKEGKTSFGTWSTGRWSRIPTVDELEDERPVAKRSPIPAPVSSMADVLMKGFNYGINMAQHIVSLPFSSQKENIVTSLEKDEDEENGFGDDDLAIPSSALGKKPRPDSILSTAGMTHLGAGIPSSTMRKRYDHPFAEAPTSAEAAWASNMGGGSKYFLRQTKVVEVLDDDESHRRPDAEKEPLETARERKQLDKVLFTFPEGSQDSVSITVRDVQKLSQDAFLNDSLIDFYLKHAVSMDPAVKQDRVHVFTSFLYTRMLDGLKSDQNSIDLDQVNQFAPLWYKAYSQVRRWTVGEDLFSKSCIIFPINSGFHWSFAACCFENRGNKESPPRGRILTFDSANVSSHDPAKIAELIRIYLNHEFESRIKLKMEPKPRNIKSGGARLDEDDDDDDDFVPEILDNVQHLTKEKEDPLAFTLSTIYFDENTVPVWKVPVPKQLDGVNCGVHLLNNAKRLIQLVSLLENGIESIDQFVGMVQNTFIGLNFRTEDANLMRETLKKEIKEIAEQAELARAAAKARGE